MEFLRIFVTSNLCLETKAEEGRHMANQQGYHLEAEPDGVRFWFYSLGPKGRIKKGIEFTPMSAKNFYNLAFGDWDESIDAINDLSVSDNQDVDAILRTVASAVDFFTLQHPEVFIFAIGSTATRTRLYRIAISKNIQEICDNFDVWGLLENQWQPFVPNRNYQGFLVGRKAK